MYIICRQSLSYLVEGKQQFLLKVWTHWSDLRVKMLQPIDQQPRTQSRLCHLWAAGKDETERLHLWKCNWTSFEFPKALIKTSEKTLHTLCTVFGKVLWFDTTNKSHILGVTKNDLLWATWNLTWLLFIFLLVHHYSMIEMVNYCCGDTIISDTSPITFTVISR